MSILELRETYDKLISREKKAEKFLDDPNVELSVIKSWISEYIKITENLSLLMVEYKTITGYEMTESEVSNGF